MSVTTWYRLQRLRGRVDVSLRMRSPACLLRRDPRPQARTDTTRVLEARVSSREGSERGIAGGVTAMPAGGAGVSCETKPIAVSVARERAFVTSCGYPLTSTLAFGSSGLSRTASEYR
jgi:hypothetical protein